MPNDKMLQQSVDPRLWRFFDDISRFSILQLNVGAPSAAVEIPKNLVHKMKRKKEYEIKQLLPKLLDECKKADVKTVIDIGCGTVRFFQKIND